MRQIERICWVFFALSVFWFWCYDVYRLQQIFDLRAAEWAAWIQAIGSILAIFIALLVVSRQVSEAAKLAFRTERRAKVDKIKGYAAIMDYACKYVMSCASTYRETDDSFFRLQMPYDMNGGLKLKIQAIEAIDLHALGLDTLIMSVQETKSILYKLDSLVQRFEAGDKYLIDEFSNVLNNSADQLAGYRKIFEDSIYLFERDAI